MQSLSELNALLAQVLTVLYDDTRHARAMSTGMLRSLFDSDSADSMTNKSFSSGLVLDRTLAVHPSLAYSKHSGGERKRIDLALFFSLLQLGQAGSAHRAHYLLVDEVFDNLDEAGQASIVRWCGLMVQRVAGWIIVITYSRFLVERDREEDTRKILVIRARMGQEGIELAPLGIAEEVLLRYPGTNKVYSVSFDLPESPVGHTVVFIGAKGVQVISRTFAEHGHLCLAPPLPSEAVNPSRHQSSVLVDDLYSRSMLFEAGRKLAGVLLIANE